MRHKDSITQLHSIIQQSCSQPDRTVSPRAIRTVINGLYVVRYGSANINGCALNIDSFYYACGDDGTLWKFDGRVSHSFGTQIQLYLESNLRAITFNAGQGYIAGASSTMLASYNGPQSWYQLDEPIPANLNALTTINSPDTIIAVGDSGAIIKSTDNGKTWKSEFVGTAHDLYGISFLGNTGVIVGSEGLILYSSDAGNTWHRQVSGTQYDLHGVFLSQGWWIVVGNNGTILTTNGPGCSSKFAETPGIIDFIGPDNVMLSQTVTITNSSAQTSLNVYASIAGERKFGLNRTHLVIPPESSDTLAVSFYPVDTTHYYGELILDNDANYTPDSIPLIGSNNVIIPKTKFASIVTSRNVVVFSYQSPCDIFDSVLITNSGDTTLYITHILTTNPVWTAVAQTDTIPPGSSMPVFFYLTNLPHTAPLTGYAIIVSDANNQPVDSIFLLGSPSEPSFASMSFDKDSIVFTADYAPWLYLDSLHITNTGDTTLDIASMTTIGTNIPFTITYPDTIQHCATAGVAISFLYTNQTSNTASLVIQSNAGTPDTLPIIIHSTAAVAEQALTSAMETSIFPNPVNDNSVIEYSSVTGGMATVVLTNALGEIVSTQTVRIIPGAVERIPMNSGSAPDGMYFYRVPCNGTISQGKFIITR